jgi:hypothetical protein
MEQYQKINEPAFQTGFNVRILAGPKLQTKYVWLSTLLVWTHNTRHDLVSCNLWPQPEVANKQELNTMPMHEKRWGGIIMPSNNGWTPALKKCIPMPVSTTTTADRSIISYDITQTKHKFTKSNHDAAKPDENVWIGIYHVSLSTFWCPKCNKWESHYDSLHEDRTHWQNEKSAQQVGKQDQN